jgi:hypothetical protein
LHPCRCRVEPYERVAGIDDIAIADEIFLMTPPSRC